MATEIYVCLDLGNDTLKISFAYETRTGERYGKLMVSPQSLTVKYLAKSFAVTA